jgi:hypothetical protein
MTWGRDIARDCRESDKEENTKEVRTGEMRETLRGRQ